MHTPTDTQPQVRLDPTLLIPARNETVAASRYHPTAIDDPLPVVLIAAPYRKDDRITFGRWAPSIQYFARHGYNVVVTDLIGTGASTGTKTPFSTAEGKELADVIDWLAHQPWTTGAIGMYGLSYGAWTQYVAAAEHPPALKTIVPVAVSPSAYESSCTGGIFNPLKRATWPVQMQASRALPPSRRDADGRWARIWHDRLDALREETPWLFQFLDHEAKDTYWDTREVTPEAITIPVLAACGYRDVHTAPMVEFIEAIEAPKRLILGPWRHVLPHKGRETAIDFRRQALNWYDHFLKGADTDPFDAPPVVYWTERDGGWTIGAGQWRGIDRWPTAHRDPGTTYHATPSGLTTDTAFTGTVDRDYEFDHTVGIDSLDRVGSIENEGVDTSTDDSRSIVFETPPLADPVELTGTAHATIRVTATVPDFIIATRVMDVTPENDSKLVTVGHLRATHRTGHDTPTPLESGTTAAIDVPLKPKSHLFEQGHRIKLAISAANFPRTLPLSDHGAFTIHSSPEHPSTLVFPALDATVRDETDHLTMHPPDDHKVSVSPPALTHSHSDWENTRNHVTDSATFATTNESTVTLPHGADLTRRTEIEASVEARDPTTATFRTDVEYKLTYDAETVRARAVGRTARSLAVLTTKVFVDDETIFDERWTKHYR